MPKEKQFVCVCVTFSEWASSSKTCCTCMFWHSFDEDFLNVNNNGIAYFHLPSSMTHKMKKKTSVETRKSQSVSVKRNPQWKFWESVRGWAAAFAKNRGTGMGMACFTPVTECSRDMDSVSTLHEHRTCFSSAAQFSFFFFVEKNSPLI